MGAGEQRWEQGRGQQPAEAGHKRGNTEKKAEREVLGSQRCGVPAGSPRPQLPAATRGGALTDLAQSWWTEVCVCSDGA